jgi:molecular chaperone DnaK
MPQIEVEFNIDANGILNVSATDKATGKSQKIEIKGSSGLTKDEIERMKREAEAHAGEDKSRRELVDLKNQAEHLLYTTRKSLEEHGARVSAQTRSNIESAVSNLERQVKGDDRKAIEAALKQLHDASIELGKAMYESAGAEVGKGAPGPAPGTGPGNAPGSPGSPGSGPRGSASTAEPKPDGDVIDAEYEVKD